jgi:hypothetical protein
MQKELQKIILKSLQSSGGKLSKDDLHTNPGILSYFVKDKNSYPAPQEAKEMEQIISTIDHNLSLLAGDHKINETKDPMSIIGTTGIDFELTSTGYETLQNIDENTEYKTRQELEAIVRKAENADISGSRYNKAKTELEIRHRKEMEEHAKNEPTAITITAHKFKNNGTIASQGNHSSIISTTEKSKEGFFSKFFWNVVVALVVIIVGALIIHHFKLQ